jgi:DNA replication protein DnaC
MAEVILQQFHKLTLSDQPVRRKEPPCPTKPRSVSQVLPKLWQVITELCDGKRKWPFYLHGSVGTGKSSAALCLVDLVEKAEFWPFPRFANFVEGVKDGREDWYDCGRGGTWTEKGWWGYISKLPLLVLDDVGIREQYNDNQIEALYLALEARDGKPLICTSNLSEKSIDERFGDRITSRLFCGTIHRLEGSDRRYEGK